MLDLLAAPVPHTHGRVINSTPMDKNQSHLEKLLRKNEKKQEPPRKRGVALGVLGLMLLSFFSIVFMLGRHSYWHRIYDEVIHFDPHPHGLKRHNIPLTGEHPAARGQQQPGCPRTRAVVEIGPCEGPATQALGPMVPCACLLSLRGWLASWERATHCDQRL